MPRPTPPTRQIFAALLLAALCGNALAHPGHEHSLANLFDLLHAGGALLALALGAAGLAWLHRRHAAQRAARHAAGNE